ncbi:DUF7220 family protein [Oceaniglobus roseus]|uniref:DUF7220 family protein n=1 Tax=Oceaniglobus roseus TaxID=1737570 RepID=UPI000C7F1161|nr:hypothetical protein [Kandeliimicrobium roseum]
MSQGRGMSAVEATANVVVGWVAAVLVQIMVFPAVGLHAPAWQHVTISAVFTAISFARSYVLRRIFARLG